MWETSVIMGNDMTTTIKDSRRTSVILSLRSFPVEGISKLKTTGKVVGARRKFICEKKESEKKRETNSNKL